MGLGYTWYLWCYLYQALVSVRAIEECREFLLSVLRKFDSISSPAPFPKQAPSPEPQELRWLSAAVPSASSQQLVTPFLGCASQEVRWGVPPVSSLARQIHLVNSRSRHLFSLSSHLLFSVSQPFLYN